FQINVWPVVCRERRAVRQRYGISILQSSDQTLKRWIFRNLSSRDVQITGDIHDAAPVIAVRHAEDNWYLLKYVPENRPHPVSDETPLRCEAEHHDTTVRQQLLSSGNAFPCIDVVIQSRVGHRCCRMRIECAERNHIVLFTSAREERPRIVVDNVHGLGSVGALRMVAVPEGNNSWIDLHSRDFGYTVANPRGSIISGACANYEILPRMGMQKQRNIVLSQAIQLGRIVSRISTGAVFTEINDPLVKHVVDRQDVITTLFGALRCKDA